MASRDLKVMLGSTVLALALAISATLQPTTTAKPKPIPTPTAQPTVDPTVFTNQESIFDPSTISDIHLEIPAKSKKVLANKNRDEYVPAKFQMTVGNKKTPLMDVGIKIKGTTSRYGITTTWANSSFKIKFNPDKSHKDQTLLGLKNLTLNAMTQDSSKIHETFAYEVYRAMGVPASRTGYTHLTFSKNIPKPDRGLYLVLESLDEVFLGANFTDVTQHLYENNHNFTEITPANVGRNVKIDNRFQVKEGWKATPNRNDLRAFAKGIQKSGKKLWDFLETNTDRDKLIMLFAVDNFTGGWDTYSGPLKNNFQFRSNLQGKMTFIPWGLDNTWGENWFNDQKSTNWFKNYKAPTKFHDDFFFPVDQPTAAFPGSFFIAHSAGIKDSAKMTTYKMSRGALFVKCLAYKPCKTLYKQNLKKITEWAKETNLQKRMLQISQVIKKYSNHYTKAEQNRTVKWIQKSLDRLPD